MILVAKEDVLKGLKKFKRLAKQDLLASPLTTNPEFWSEQAEGRRTTYTWLMQEIETHGVDHAYRSALKKYADLPFLYANPKQPQYVGTQQAIEMFFTIIGKPRSKTENIPTGAGDIAINAQSY